MLWRELRVDVCLYDTHQDRFNALLNSSPYGILDNVKRLNVFTTSTASSLLAKQKTASILLKLFSAFVRDNLSSLHSGTLPIHPDAICLVLKTQSQLREIDIAVDETSPDGLPGRAYARNNLSQLEKIRLDVVGSKHQTYRDACVWFAQAPKVRALVVKGRGAEAHFEGWSSSAQPNLTNLRCITLEDIHLTNVPRKILDHLHLPSLRTLVLKGCCNVTPFLLSLAQRYKEKNKSALERFALFADPLTADAQEASAELIRSSSGLKLVAIEVMTGAVIDLQCLRPHCTSLKTLRLPSSAEDTSCYSAEDLDQLRLICPSLQELAMNLGDLSPMFDDVGLSEAFRLADQMEYVQRLVSHLEFMSTKSS